MRLLKNTSRITWRLLLFRRLQALALVFSPIFSLGGGKAPLSQKPGVWGAALPSQKKYEKFFFKKSKIIFVLENNVLQLTFCPPPIGELTALEEVNANGNDHVMLPESIFLRGGIPPLRIFFLRGGSPLLEFFFLEGGSPL